MASEQIIYLSPEEDVTSVHERLEQVQAQRIVLVVPPQTHLRSLTSWRVLRSYARDLNKEVLVISSDSQIRSVAKEAKFSIANSLEAPSSSKRSESHPSRGLSRITSGWRSQSNRGARNAGRTRQPGPTRGAPSSMLPPQNPPRSPLPPAQEIDDLSHMQAPNVAGEDEEIEDTTQLGQPSSTFGGQDTPYDPSYDFRPSSPPPLHFVEPETGQDDDDLDPFKHSYEEAQKLWQAAQPQQEPGNEAGFEHISDTDGMATPSDYHDQLIAPEEDEQTGYADTDEHMDSTQIFDIHTGNNAWPTEQTPAPQVAHEDPFAERDDFRPLPLSEQHGAAILPLHGFDDEEDVTDISQYPTADIKGGEVEDMGDVDMDELPPFLEEQVGEPLPSWEEQQHEPEEKEEEEAPIAYNPPPRMRSGKLPPRMPSGKLPLRPVQMEPVEAQASAETALPPDEETPDIDIAEEPTRVIAPRLGLPDATVNPGPNRMPPAAPANQRAASGSLSPASRQKEPDAMVLPEAGRSQARPSTRQRRPAATTTQRSRRPTPASSKRPPVQPRSRSQKKRRVNWVTPLVIAGIFLLIGIFVFLLPSADVTVVLASKPYSWPVVVTASSTSKQDLTQHTVPVSTRTFTASETKSGTATGTNTTVGTAAASGTVNFTNNGTQSVLLPTGLTVSTANNVLFATAAQVLVPPGSTLPVPVQAQTAGASGNVAAGSITVIPASSITQIEQIKDNNGVTVKLSVTNPQATTGGGGASKQETTVTSKDVSTLQASITAQFATELQAWITQQSQQQHSVLAKPVPADQLSKYETVKATPAAGQVASNGTFSETVSLSLPVQFVSQSDLQAQASAQYTQLSSASKAPSGFTKPPAGYALVPGQQPQLEPKTCTSGSKTSTANASTLCFTASAPVALPISAQQVQKLITGKSVKVVQQNLASSKNGLPGIASAKVSISPGFWPWMPFLAQRINVHFTTATPSRS